jgi:hypothetical protein
VVVVAVVGVAAAVVAAVVVVEVEEVGDVDLGETRVKIFKSYHYQRTHNNPQHSLSTSTCTFDRDQGKSEFNIENIP